MGLQQELLNICHGSNSPPSRLRGTDWLSCSSDLTPRRKEPTVGK